MSELITPRKQAAGATDSQKAIPGAGTKPGSGEVSTIPGAVAYKPKKHDSTVKNTVTQIGKY